eukprot:2893124-Alexandrium_andersonii.AAC.1
MERVDVRKGVTCLGPPPPCVRPVGHLFILTDCGLLTVATAPISDCGLRNAARKLLRSAHRGFWIPRSRHWGRVVLSSLEGG